MLQGISWSRFAAAATLILAAAALGAARSRPGADDPTAHLELSVLVGAGDRPTPSRVYLFKDDRPFRFSPVDVMLPLRVDLFYRERLWRRPPEQGTPRTLEVTNDGESHFILLEGTGRYDLPAGRYRVEAYRGLSWAPAAEEFALGAGESRSVALRLQPLERPGEAPWLSGDDHIHLTRAAEDDPAFLAWLQADDLNVGNFLQLQRQVDAAVQHAFGRRGEARAPGYTIRSGQESRSEFYGHVNLLGPSRLLRPVSIGSMYADAPEAYPFPNLLFSQARALGATVGYAHFDGSMKHSALMMDLALGAIDFIEVFQFGELKTAPWYELLNAGFRVTGIAGSDFPANLSRFKPWPRAIPLLGPERTLVKPSANAGPDRSEYDLWAEGVRAGAVVVSNGPLLELAVEGRPPGAVLDWRGASRRVRGEAHVVFHRPIDALEIVINGQVVASAAGNGRLERLSLPFETTLTESAWIAARARARSIGDEPVLQAHANPVYVLRERRPPYVQSARDALAARWKREIDYYKGADLIFADPKHREALVARLDEVARILESEPRPWP